MSPRGRRQGTRAVVAELAEAAGTGLDEEGVPFDGNTGAMTSRVYRNPAVRACWMMPGAGSMSRPPWELAVATTAGCPPGRRTRKAAGRNERDWEAPLVRTSASRPGSRQELGWTSVLAGPWLY